MRNPNFARRANARAKFWTPLAQNPESAPEFRERVWMCWELVNREWTVWMPARLLQCLSVAERGVSFQDRRSEPPRKTDLCNEMSQDGVIVCHSSSTLYYYDVIYHIPTSVTSQFFFFCNRGERKRNGPLTLAAITPWGVAVFSIVTLDVKLGIYMGNVSTIVLA